jgi:hypothetical protein
MSGVLWLFGSKRAAQVGPTPALPYPRCLAPGWALVAKPRGFVGPTAVGVLPWHQAGPYELSLGLHTHEVDQT